MKPYDIELEKNVLMMLILDKELANDKVSLLHEDDFTQQNKDIFIAIQALIDNNETIDMLTVDTYLKNKNKNYTQYIKQIIDEGETVEIDEAIKILKEKTKLRSIIVAGQKLIQIAKDDTELEYKLNKVQEVMNAIENNSTVRAIERIDKIIVDTMKIFEDRYKNKDKAAGLDTGFTDINNATGGLRGGELITIAGRPGMGKTSFALDIALNVAKQKNTVLIFSLEMSKEQLGERAFIQTSFIDGYQIRTGKIQDETWKKLTHSLAQFAGMPLYVDDNTDTNIYEMRNICRQFKRQYDLKLVIVDYLQLMEGGTGDTYENRQNEVSKISRNLKKLARELNIPVIALSQLNRSVEQRANKRPMLSDLRESGSIEQDSDMVWLLYRDEYYNKDTKDKNIVEVNIAKQRSGPTGTIQLAFFKDYITFRNLKR